MDRTNWKFGESNINVLMIVLIYQGLSFPLMFKLLPKAGNSNADERIALIDSLIRFFEIQALDCLTADCELVVEKWIKYLNNLNIRYYIRIHENFWVLQPHNGKRVSLLVIYQFAIKQLPS